MIDLAEEVVADVEIDELDVHGTRDDEEAGDEVDEREGDYEEGGNQLVLLL